MSKLNVKKIAAWKGPGLLSDGGNLYLTGDGAGRKSWLFVFLSPVTKKQRSMGLGPAGAFGVSLAEARDKATAARALLRNGLDPIDARKAEQESQRAAARKIPTFGALADQYVTDHRSSWKNPKHIAQWTMTLTVHAAPLRAKPVNEITTEDVLATLKPLWSTVPETAKRLRGRIENVLDAAKVAGHRSGENPAAWRGHLAHLLPKGKKLVHGHFRALPFRQMPDFMEALRKRGDVGARLLEFTILCAARSGEARGAAWPEFDLKERVWTVPGSRMKAGRPHSVPLSERALEILALMQTLKVDGCDLVFPSLANKPYSDMAMTKTLRNMGYAAAATTHGFRSSFKDWCNEATSYANELSERALAHVISNQAEAAYSRSDLLAKRREMMEAWSRFCRGGADVIQLTQRA
jgi:integrase